MEDAHMRLSPEAASVPPGSVGEGPGWTRAIASALALAAAAAFLPVLGNGFVLWDDDENFFENHHFGGLCWATVRWAWTTTRLGVYQPLAWILLEAQATLWGLDARGYHAASLFL